MYNKMAVARPRTGAVIPPIALPIFPLEDKLSCSTNDGIVKTTTDIKDVRRMINEKIIILFFELYMVPRI